MINETKFKSLLGYMESGDNYKSKNSIGALGRYQFMPATLNSLKNKYNLAPWYDAEYFLKSPLLQETYASALIKDNLKFIDDNNLKTFNGRLVTGSKRFKTITAPLNVYGMLAAMHLAGPKNLVKFLTTGYNPDDGNTSLSDYAALFSSKLTGLENITPLILAFIPALLLYYL